MKKEQKLVKLSPGEAELLELFWEHGQLTLPKAYELYLGTGKSPSYSTIQTRLNRMVDKGLLDRSSDFPAVYSTNIAREDAQGKYFELLDTLAGKNLAPLMLHLFEKRSLTPDEIATMKAILEQIETRQIP
jgi:predicted transcriptional regulator